MERLREKQRIQINARGDYNNVPPVITSAYMQIEVCKHSRDFAFCSDCKKENAAPPKPMDQACLD